MGAENSQGNAGCAISVSRVSKYYEMYKKPAHRLFQMVCRGRNTKESSSFRGTGKEARTGK